MAMHAKSPTAGTPPSHPCPSRLHRPPMQEPPEQLTPHPPQLFGSMLVSTHLPLQAVRPPSQLTAASPPPESPLPESDPPLDDPLLDLPLLEPLLETPLLDPELPLPLPLPLPLDD